VSAAARQREAVLALAQRLARAAGALQRARWESDLRIETKSSAVDLVTDVDRACEALVVAGIRAERPGDAVLAEEGSGFAPPGAELRWVIDPLDGTTNYAHGYPWFCVSIGVERDGRPELGVIYNPVLDELYHAVRGGGAFRDGRPIRVSPERELARSLLATGFAYDRRERASPNLPNFGRFLRAARAVRRDGSAALDLAAVACGRLDGYWELDLRPWDVSAGGLLVTEAGGRLSDLSGAREPWDGACVVASNGAIHDAMLAVLAASAAGAPPGSP
jgi:myo-inositol-1(or 4)-monophosphatase